MFLTKNLNECRVGHGPVFWHLVPQPHLGASSACACRHPSEALLAHSQHAPWRCDRNRYVLWSTFLKNTRAPWIPCVGYGPFVQSWGQWAESGVVDHLVLILVDSVQGVHGRPFTFVKECPPSVSHCHHALYGRVHSQLCLPGLGCLLGGISTTSAHLFGLSVKLAEPVAGRTLSILESILIVAQGTLGGSH